MHTMFQPIQISIPAEKYTEDVYIILEKLEGEVNTSENSRYYPEHRDKTYPFTNFTIFNIISSSIRSN